MDIVGLWQRDKKQCYEVDIGRLTLWFSYQSVIGFRFSGKIHWIENHWNSSYTTKHMQEFDSRPEERIPRTEFEQRLTDALIYCRLIDETENVKCSHYGG